MKKFFKKLAVAAVVAASVVCAAMSFVGCGEPPAEPVTTYVYYGADFMMSEGAMSTQIPGSATVTTFSDGTYVLNVDYCGYMNGTYGRYSRMGFVTSFGAYELSEADADGIAKLSLAAPVRVIYSESNKYILDSANETTFGAAPEMNAETLLTAYGREYKELSVDTEHNVITSKMDTIELFGFVIEK